MHIRNIESELNLMRQSRVWRIAEFFRRLFYLKLLGKTPLLQKGAMTISREGFKVFYYKAKNRLKGSWQNLNKIPEYTEKPLSNIDTSKKIDDKSYILLSEVDMKADREDIARKLRGIIKEIGKEL